MPGRDGTLTADDKTKLINWLNSKKGKPECPVCAQNNWFIPDHIVSGNIYQPNVGLSVGGPTYPTIMMVCGNCAYVRSFMAVAVGVLPGANQNGS